MNFKLLLLSAFIAVAVGRGQESDSQSPKRPEFVYLGSIARQTGISTSQATLNESFYYASSGTTTWNEAGHDCSRWFSGESGLVEIESEFENTELTKLLESYGSVGRYWTGGGYSISRKAFIWDTSDTQVPTGEGWSYNPWASGHPTSNPSSQTRTLLYYLRLQSEWATESSTVNLRYICEAF